jgi:hypothetical protein
MDALEQMALDLEDAQALRQMEMEDDGIPAIEFWTVDEYTILETITLFRKRSHTYEK